MFVLYTFLLQLSPFSSFKIKKINKKCQTDVTDNGLSCHW